MIKVSMTSYPGRITNVGKSIYLLLNKQTVKPDEIHCWLSIEEFKNKETDLPKDLLTILNHEKVLQRINTFIDMHIGWDDANETNKVVFEIITIYHCQ